MLEDVSPLYCLPVQLHIPLGVILLPRGLQAQEEMTALLRYGPDCILSNRGRSKYHHIKYLIFLQEKWKTNKRILCENIYNLTLSFLYLSV